MVDSVVCLSKGKWYKFKYGQNISFPKMCLKTWHRSSYEGDIVEIDTFNELKQIGKIYGV